MHSSELDFVVNGQRHQVMARHHWTLLEVLRYQLHFTGSKQGCDKGDCGACTVLIGGESAEFTSAERGRIAPSAVDGKPVLSCITLAHACAGKHITTIEGLTQGDRLDPVQYAFDRCGALQCGFCQSGMMISARALLNRMSTPTLSDIHEALGGNLCRCTGYTKIVTAVQEAARLIRNPDA